MRTTKLLHNLGQNIDWNLLDTGTLKCCIDELSNMGPALNPTIFDYERKP